MKPMRMMPMLLTLLLLGCALPAGVPKAKQGPAPAPIPETATDTPKRVPPAPAAATADEVIGTKIRRQFDILDPQAFGTVRIQVADGLVTLTGSVPDLRTAWRAISAAGAVAGVKKVNNELLVNLPSR
jgi:hypothetical protein